jgi:hypothetical protein
MIAHTSVGALNSGAWPTERRTAAGGPFRKVWLRVAQENSEPVLRTRSDAEMLAVRRCSLSVDVSTIAPAGCQRIAADLFVSQSVRPTPQRSLGPTRDT